MAKKVDDGAEVAVEPANSLSAPTLWYCPMLLIDSLGTTPHMNDLFLTEMLLTKKDTR
jgi:hypothetical protein